MEVTFTRKADPRLTDPEFLKKLEGNYERNGIMLTILLRNNELVINTAPPRHLIPYKNNSFVVREFSDQVVEFSLDAEGNATGFKTIVDGREYQYLKKN
jgi:hypothetical protein